MPVVNKYRAQRKEQASIVSFNPIPEHFKPLFRHDFKIPSEVTVEGILFEPRGAIGDTYREALLIELLTINNISPFTSGPINSFEYQLPPVFEEGTLSIGMAEGVGNERLYQSVLRFRSAQDHPIRYQTPAVVGYENVYSMISRTAILACLPIEVLRRVRNDGSMIVINNSVNEGGKFYRNPTLLELKWNEAEQLIDASIISPSWEKAVTEAKGAFFILD